jgi:hypothetical protein
MTLTHWIPTGQWTKMGPDVGLCFGWSAVYQRAIRYAGYLEKEDVLTLLSGN